MKTRPSLLAASRALVLVAAGSATTAFAAGSDKAQRASIRSERTAAETLYQQDLQACSTRFVVTACVDEARVRRHAKLSELDRQQEVLDEAERTERAAERRRSIEQKASGEEARQREEAARAAARPAADAPRAAASAASAANASSARAPRPPVDPAVRAEQETRARHAYELKQLQAEAHRQEVERRNQERARKANPGAPLPVPPASAVLAASAPRTP